MKNLTITSDNNRQLWLTGSDNNTATANVNLGAKLAVTAMQQPLQTQYKDIAVTAAKTSTTAGKQSLLTKKSDAGLTRIKRAFNPLYHRCNTSSIQLSNSVEILADIDSCTAILNHPATANLS